MRTTTAAVRVAGAASATVHARVAQPSRAATVLHAGREAVYVEVDGSCLAVLSRRAVLVPCGVRTPLPALPAVASGEPMTVGDGSVAFDRYDVVVDSVLDTRDTVVPALDARAAAWGAVELRRLSLPLMWGVRASLPEEALGRLTAGDPRSVSALLGLGPGLTPLGDDVLCGWLATAAATRNPALGAVRHVAVPTATARTTLLSATLLGCAARGEVVPEFGSMLQAMAHRNRSVLRRSAERLLGIGDTSGAGLLLGVALALEVAR